MLVLTCTGLRWGEAIGLCEGSRCPTSAISVSVDAVEVGPEIQVGAPKTHERRTVPFLRLLEPVLVQQAAARDVEQLLFTGRKGLHLRRVRVSSGSPVNGADHAPAGRLEPMTLHDLRRIAVSLSIGAGMHIAVIQRMRGYASAAMTPDMEADLFDDLHAVPGRLDEAYEHSAVGDLWADSPANPVLTER